MNTPLHIDPALHDRAVKECLDAHNRGNPVRALTLAMTAGVNAGVLGMDISECPRLIAGYLDLYLQWIWGRGQALKANDNSKQGNLL